MNAHTHTYMHLGTHKKGHELGIKQISFLNVTSIYDGNNDVTETRAMTDKDFLDIQTFIFLITLQLTCNKQISHLYFIY